MSYLGIGYPVENPKRGPYSMSLGGGAMAGPVRKSGRQSANSVECDSFRIQRRSRTRAFELLKVSSLTELKNNREEYIKCCKRMKDVLERRKLKEMFTARRSYLEARSRKLEEGITSQGAAGYRPSSSPHPNDFYNGNLGSADIGAGTIRGNNAGVFPSCWS